MHLICSAMHTCIYNINDSVHTRDCYIDNDNGKLATLLNDKKDDFNFPILNFSFLSSCSKHR